MNDLWSWIGEAIEHYRETGDRERFEIAVLYYRGAQQMESDPVAALANLEQARDLAERLREPWWMLLCDHWRCQTMLFHTGSIDQALHLATEGVAIADTAHEFTRFPQRVCLHDDQISAFQMMDPLGYAPEIEAGCAYIETQGPDLEGCQHCKRTARIDSLIAQGQLDQAEAAAREALKDCRSKTASHYTPQYYAALCRVAAQQEDSAALETWARSGDLFYGRMGSPQSNVELLMWHALALRRLSQSDRAKSAYRKARSAQRRAQGRQTPGYYDALARYHEAAGQIALALIARGIELRTVTGAPYLEGLCRLERVRLLQALDRPYHEECASTVRAAHALRDPKPILARLRALTEGERFSRHDLSIVSIHRQIS